MLRKLLDSLEPTFKHGPLKRFYPFFEAADTFLYTPGTKTQSGPHVRDGIDLKRTMISVVIALLPCTLFGMWNVGYQSMHAADPSLTPGAANFFEAFKIGLLAFLPIYVVTLAVGGTLEAIFAVVRKHEINEGFLVTSLLFPLILPPTIPLWQVGLGIAFGVVVGKEIFGGTGMNILNPALTARLFLYIAYPAQISGDVVWIGTAGGKWADGFSGATPLADFYNTGVTHVPYMDAFLGFIPGCIGETSVVACLLGAAYLIFAKVGSWRIMLSCLLGLIATGLLFNALSPSPEHYLAVTPWWHLAVGGFAFGAVFMATDPVSAAQTNTGRWIYGFLIGALTAVVRVLNPAYPEGIMLAIIFMNVFAPTIDYYVTKANIKRREARLGVQ
ncbi:MAG: NADH:ubiquinone reductase (Na(+)-transporting) subunit B [Planctomycetes bacterium]|nr:NADH:ubiquinone reductase (Na(+)-transporting) subunit B [Planctomycetota bacterium]MCB9913137.1 NADH:ubiquinone reductase (Na(+)-transporting) subunit B [Planctomycetota bacterium]HPF13361.1 NADH:ubiquinone reductase (Na(+)-transporting) subunit B [Planctomycetota bacterium]HRV80339.1 NADH:ubiquinone reductase (Na(+)-transporting) subunit B [Planctomycetota bacterium]